MFDTRFARRRADRYRRRGLDKTSRRMVDLLAQRGVQDATVLEIGGGVGEIQIELLKRGAASATNLELSPAYDAEARQLIAETGLTGRVERRLIDIAANPAAVKPADIVVLNRVVCCYPDYSTLLATAADHARQQVVFSYPPRNLAREPPSARKTCCSACSVATSARSRIRRRRCSRYSPSTA